MHDDEIIQSLAKTLGEEETRDGNQDNTSWGEYTQLRREKIGWGRSRGGMVPSRVWGTKRGDRAQSK